jgi:hypothetical protein
MKLQNKRWLLVLITASMLLQPVSLLAADYPKPIENKPLNETELRNERLGTDFSELGDEVCTEAVAQEIPPSIDLPNAIRDGVTTNSALYQKVGTATGVPWQMIAGIHYRETSFGRNNPANGQGIFQNLNGEGGPYPTGPVGDAEFERQLTFLANRIQNDYVKRNLPDHRVKLDGDSTDPEVIKDTLYSYNGRAKLYAEQAAKRGFNPNTQPYEGSPYVMNNYDDAHKDLTADVADKGVKLQVDPRLGAFTVYARLKGISGPSGAAGCADGDDIEGGVGAETGNKIVDIAAAELGVIEQPKGSNGGGRVDTYTDGHNEFWCADFVSWVYKQAGTPFTGGSSGGWRIAGVTSVKAWFQKNGIWFDKNSSEVPQPGDAVFFFSKPNQNSSSGNHIGIVEKVEGDTLYTIEGNSSDAVRRRSYNYKTSNYVKSFGRLKQ